MKKIFYIIVILSMISLVLILSGNTDKSFKIDDAVFAVSVDDNLVDTFPEKISMAGYNINIDCKNALGVWDVVNWKLELKNITNDVECNLDFIKISTSNISEYTLNNIVKNDDEVINDNGYRYIGSNPNNYVWYNNELWRIIGSIPTTKSDGNETNLVKIIRNDSLSVVNFDYHNWTDANGDYINSWGSNSLSTILNSYYYGRKNATYDSADDITIGLCGLYNPPNSTFGKCDYRGIGISKNSDADKMIQEVYWNVGKITATNITNINFDCSGEASSKINKKIGLASCSDYKYIYKNNHQEHFVNWMSIKGVQYLISPQNDEQVLYITPNGTFGVTYVYNPMNVFPALYLKENVYVVSGDGSINNPYQIAM